MNPVKFPPNSEWVEGRTEIFELPCGHKLPVRWSHTCFKEAHDVVLVDAPARLEPLSHLDDYPHIKILATDPDVALQRVRQRQVQIRGQLNHGIYIFGAYKVGINTANEARKAGIFIKGFLDNDLSKEGRSISDTTVFHPSSISLQNGDVVVIASGQHSNAIYEQLSLINNIHIVNLHEFFYAIDALHHCDKFSAFVELPLLEPARFISTFLRLDDERSRQIYDVLIGMRIQLSTAIAKPVISPHSEEYFDSDFVSHQSVFRFVDAGAATGDTLQRLEKHFGFVERAWLFEPELASYYEALKNFAERPNIWVFNMGLDEVSSRAHYQQCLSFDVANELNSIFPTDITSYIQGVPLDGIIQEKIGFLS